MLESKELPLPLSCNEVALDSSPERFGSLTESFAHEDTLQLQQRLQDDGYLFMRGLLNRDDIQAARTNVLEQLNTEGLINTNFPLDEGIALPGDHSPFRPEMAQNNPLFHKVLYEGPMMEFHTRLLGDTVRHFDYTWFRPVSGRRATWPHCDIVYMGRGTPRLLTTWVPYGDTPIKVGGLILLEKSNQMADRIRKYLNSDVDSYCENKPERKGVGFYEWMHDGTLSKQPDTLPEKFNSRWLTADYRMGDVIIFGMEMIHGSLDNQTNRFRLSSDSRYQLASEPADERWIGDKPPGHGPHVSKGVIC